MWKEAGVLIIGWVRCLGNETSQKNSFGSGGAWRAFWLEDEAGLSQTPPCARLMTWVMEQGIFTLHRAEYPERLCEHTRGEDIIQNDCDCIGK